MIDGLGRMASKVWNHPGNRDRRLRQLAAAIRFQSLARITRSPVRIRIGESSCLWATLDNGPSILAAYARQPDYAEWNVWRRQLRPDDLFVDVGANVGIYTILAQERGAQVVSVEPHPSIADRLRRNLELNGAHAEIHQLALDEQPGTLHLSEHLDAMNHLQTQNGLTVRGETLDNLIGDRIVRGLKVDVEGAENRVLRGAVRALSEGRIEIAQLEWNDTARANFGEGREAVADLLAGYGYSLYRPALDGTLQPTTAEEGTDVFAARPAAVRHLIASV